MIILILGIILFMGAHLLAAGPMRGALSAKLGKGGRKLFVTIGATAGLGLIIWGMSIAPFIPVYDPPPWARYVAIHAMPAAFALLALAYAPGKLRAILRHPMLLAVLLWAGLHLLANGDWASLTLFGGFAVYAPVSIWLAEARNYAPAPKGRWAWDGAAIVTGLVVAYFIMKFHGLIFGVSVI